MIEVLRPGFLTTIQDLGRTGFEHLGVSPAGVADPVSARIANRLVGNRDSDPVFECTGYGPRLRFAVDTCVAVCGGTFDCSVPMWRSVHVPRGSDLDIRGAVEGFRCYVSVSGGLDCPRYLGSASVHVASGFGKPLARGEVLVISSGWRGAEAAVQDVLRFEGRVRVTLGPDADDFSARDFYLFASQEWRVTQESNRQGIRLVGEQRIESRGGGNRPSEGVALGAVQIFRDGQPAILFVDSQTTGGYPVIANMIAADQCRVAQLRPGSMVRFEPVSLGEARRLFLDQEEWIQRVGR